MKNYGTYDMFHHQGLPEILNLEEPSTVYLIWKELNKVGSEMSDTLLQYMSQYIVLPKNASAKQIGVGLLICVGGGLTVYTVIRLVKRPGKKAKEQISQTRPSLGPSTHSLSQCIQSGHALKKPSSEQMCTATQVKLSEVKLSNSSVQPLDDVTDPDEMRQHIQNLREDILTLQSSLREAVTGLSSELDSIKSAVTLSQQNLHAGMRRNLSSRTLKSDSSYKTAGTWDADDNNQDEEYDSGESEYGSVTKSSDDRRVPDNSERSLNNLLRESDFLYEGSESQREEAFRMLLENEMMFEESWEMAWRLARAHVGAYDVRPTAQERSMHAGAALEYSRKALRLKEDSATVHKWHVISLGATTDFLSTKEKIETAFELCTHIDRAIALEPHDPSMYFMKGRWCWAVYMLSWIERKLAATLFAKPPTASIDDALENFISAEQLAPGFYKANQYYIAKCYHQKNNRSESLKWLNSAIRLPIRNKDDSDTHRQAEKLRMKLT